MKTAERTVDRPTATMSRRDERAIAVFGTWMLVGLFLDGWAHQARKPESFFTPWHGVLYSGFGAAVAFFTVMGWLDARRGTSQGSMNDRLTAAGFATFIVGAIGDFVWHSLFGIEADLEALLSPTHLALMIGGLLMLTGPIRSAWADPSDRTTSLRDFAPTIVAFTLCTALVSFFTMYISAFLNNAPIFPGGRAESVQVWGVTSVLATNAILMAPVMLVLRRWTPPFGSFALLFGVVAFATTGVHGFRMFPLTIAAVVGGLAADVLVDRGASARAIGIVTPAVLWTAWLLVLHAGWRVQWPAELSAGTVVLAAMTGLGLSVLAFPPRVPEAQSATRDSAV